jgi:sialate O-acetylesterase
MIGEVWLCSGQSNMDWGLGGLEQGKAEAPNATNTKIRFFTVPKTTSQYPQINLEGEWKVCSPDEAKNFSAVGYFFGKKLQGDLNVPVGMINSSWGGTAAEIWTPKEVIENDPVLLAEAKKIKTDWLGWPIIYSYSYNGMIYPITNFRIKGALWYQGESNTGANATYTSLLSKMIHSWRKEWEYDFPFYLVQIAPYAYGGGDIGARLREAQSKVAQTVPSTGIVVISDLVDDVKDIHPKNKKDVGLRLANYVLGDHYGKTGFNYKNPTYKSMSVEKDKVIITFNNASQGLMSKDGAPKDFWIAGEDKKFVRADAKIVKNTVVVSSKSVKKPVAVRFGFTNTSTPNLFSKDGLPVDLFRTDDWEVMTEPQQ